MSCRPHRCLAALSLLLLLLSLIFCPTSAQSSYGAYAGLPVEGVNGAGIAGNGEDADSDGIARGMNIRKAPVAPVAPPRVPLTLPFGDDEGSSHNQRRAPPPPSRRQAQSEGQCQFDPNKWRINAQSAAANAIMFDRTSGLSCSDCLELCANKYQSPSHPWICRSLTYDHRWKICDLYAVNGSGSPYFLVDYKGRDYFDYLAALPPTDNQLKGHPNSGGPSVGNNAIGGDEENNNSIVPLGQPPPPGQCLCPCKLLGDKTANNGPFGEKVAELLEGLEKNRTAPGKEYSASVSAAEYAGIGAEEGDETDSNSIGGNAVGAVDGSSTSSTTTTTASSTESPAPTLPAALSSTAAPAQPSGAPPQIPPAIPALPPLDSLFPVTLDAASAPAASPLLPPPPMPLLLSPGSIGSNNASSIVGGGGEQTVTPVEAASSSAIPPPTPPAPPSSPPSESSPAPPPLFTLPLLLLPSSNLPGDISTPPPPPLIETTTTTTTDSSSSASASSSAPPSISADDDLLPETSSPSSSLPPPSITPSSPSSSDPTPPSSSTSSSPPSPSPTSPAVSSNVSPPAEPSVGHKALSSKTFQPPYREIRVPFHKTLEKLNRMSAPLPTAPKRPGAADGKVPTTQSEAPRACPKKGQLAHYVEVGDHQRLLTARRAGANSLEEIGAKDAGECMDACDSPIRLSTCNSAVFSAAHRCELSSSAANHSAPDSLLAAPKFKYMEKMCLDASLSRGDDRRRIFPAVIGYILVGHVQEVSNAGSLSECIKACLLAESSFGFLCKSVMFYPTDTDQNCLMNSESRHTQSEVFVQEDPNVHMLYVDIEQPRPAPSPLPLNEDERRRFKDVPLGAKWRKMAKGYSNVEEAEWTRWSKCLNSSSSSTVMASEMRHRYLKCREAKDIRKCPKESVPCKKMMKPLRIQRIWRKAASSAPNSISMFSSSPPPAESRASECLAVRDALGLKRCPYGMRWSGSQREFCSTPIDC